MKKRFYFLLLLFFVSTIVSAKEYDPEKLVEKGIEQYMVEDFTGAIGFAEEALRLNPDHQQARDILIRSVKRLASKYLEQNKYKKALPYLERASALAPQNQEIARMLTETKSKIEAKEKEERLAQEAKAAAARQAALWEEELKKRKEKDLAEWKRRMARKRALDLRRIQEEVNARKKKAEKELMESLGVKEEEWEAKLSAFKRSFWIGGIGFFVLTLIFIIGIFVWGRRVSQIRDITQYQIKEEVLNLISQKTAENWEPLKEEEDKILAQTEKILQIEDRIARSLEEKISELDEKQSKLLEDKMNQISEQQKSLISEQTEKMLKLLEINQEENLINAQNRVLDLLEKTSLLAVPELVEQWKKEQFSSEYARTTPSTHVLKVTQRAKELYQAAPEKALELLGKLSEDPDRWVRISVISALNEIDEPEGIDILLSLLKDRVKSVKTAAYQALERKVARGREVLPEELAKRILNALRQAKI